jgi:GTP-binding protein
MRTVVAIVGRANVGKSTLFNRIIKAGGNKTKPTAITENIPGVTRDRNYGEAQWNNKVFVIVDTGGFYTEDVEGNEGEIIRQMREQALYAIEEADIIIHLLDAKSGLNPSDTELANILRESGKKVLWVVNKIDSPSKEIYLYEFYKIGADKIFPLSAITGYGFDELMDEITALIPEEESAKIQEEIPKIAVVGRPNVGKSTLINSLLGKKRLIVSPVPGTTRDAIDSICSYYGKKYLFIDTAGLRKKSAASSLERFAVARAIRSIERADVVLIVLDVSEGIVEQDQKIAGLVEEYGKGAIFLLNKWDLISDPEREYKKIVNELRSKMWFMDYVPYLTISGVEKKRITKIFPLIDEIIKERQKKIPTAELNRFLEKVKSEKIFPIYKGKELKFLYMTQVGINPPQFSIFVNYPSAVKSQHMRFIERMLREEYSFIGTPIRIFVKSR